MIDINNFALKIKNLDVCHGNQHILKNINLNIPRHKVTVILGPSGCGKTTLLKCLNRLLDLYNGLKVSGSIILDNEDILKSKNHLTRIRQKMGLLSQHPYPLPMSIFDNVAYGLKIKGVKNKQVLNERVKYYLNQVGLWDEVKDRLKSPASRLSIGQQQRLCLARGLAVEPEIILADEPTSALDPISSTHIEEQFKILKDKYTIILVSHILRQAKRLADYVVFMYYGEVVEQGPPQQIFEHPRNSTTIKYLEVGH
jgi:phosphate transport system ATP-binding protein